MPLPRIHHSARPTRLLGLCLLVVAATMAASMFVAAPRAQATPIMNFSVSSISPTSARGNTTATYTIVGHFNVGSQYGTPRFSLVSTGSLPTITGATTAVDTVLGDWAKVTFTLPGDGAQGYYQVHVSQTLGTLTFNYTTAQSPGAFDVLNAVPTTAGISPTWANTGSGTTMLTVSGNYFARLWIPFAGYVPNSYVYWGSDMLPTVWVSSTTLLATIPGSLLNQTGQAQITVHNTLDGTVSNPQTFTVTAPAACSSSSPPVISGSTALNGVLSCTTGSWSGYPMPTLRGYQWLRNGAEILPATSSTYQVTAADQGRDLSCVVTYTNMAGSASASSVAVSIPAAVGAPVNSVAPAISGTPAVGSLLTCSQGSWSGSPTSYGYAWQRNNTAIAGANTSAYTVTTADQGDTITCIVTATNAGGSNSASSSGVQVPPAPVPPKNTDLPVVSGSTALGGTLTCSTGSWSGSPTPTVSGYQWLRDGSDIAGAASSSYTVTTADQGHLLSCTVTATNAGGSVSVTSAQTAIPAAATPPAIAFPPVISGTPAVGSTLSCSTGTWSGSPTSYAYQWLRNGAAIGGATSASFMVTSADQGFALSCLVTATNAVGSTGATSHSVLVPPATTAATSKAPVLLRLSPKSGRIGIVVTLYGRYFGKSRGAGIVRFGAKKVARYVRWSATMIKVKVPTGTAKGKVKVTVRTAAGTSTTLHFTRK